MKKHDEYRVVYKCPYYYVMDESNAKHFGFYKFKENADWRCAWLNSQ